mgnify:CR=1 FL=1
MAGGKIVTIFGGSGFVGTQIVQDLARKGYRIRVAVRRPDLAGHVKPLGAVGQIQPIQANVRNPESVARAVMGADIVINLTGILFESGRQRFRAVHAMGAKNVAAASKKAGVATLVHMSAIGADTASESAYGRSKALGEADVLKVYPDAVIIRPSLIFGQGDGLFNLFGSLARISPILPVIEGATKFQPVYVGDVAEAFVAAAEGKAKPGAIYELGGPETETMHEIMSRVVHETGRGNVLLPLPTSLAKLMAFFTGLLPNPMLTVDQVIQLGTDNVVSDSAKKQKRTLDGLGVTPTAMDAVLPTYMWRFRKHGQFDKVEA